MTTLEFRLDFYSPALSSGTRKRGWALHRTCKNISKVCGAQRMHGRTVIEPAEHIGKSVGCGCMVCAEDDDEERARR